MTIKHTENQWLHYYQDASRMRLDIEVVREDIIFQQQGGHISYAVDTNAIFFYARPCEEKEIAKVFRDEEDESTLNAESILLADFIFLNGLIGENEYFLYPEPILGEFHSIYIEELGDRKETNKVFGELSNLNEIKLRIENYEKGKVETESQLIDYLVENCPNLVSYLHNEKYTGITSVIQRMGELGRKSKLQKMGANKSLPIPDNSDLKTFMKPWKEFQSLASKTSRKHFNIQNDIKTLAWITFVNNYFYKNNINERLVYLSVDKIIHKVASNLAKSGDILQNFSRHPRQYINLIRLSAEKRIHSFDDKLTILNEFQILIDKFLEPFRIDINGNLIETEEYLKNLQACSEGVNTNIDKILNVLETEADFKTQYEELKKKRERLLSLSTVSRVLSTADKASELAKIMREKGINQLFIEKRKEVFDDVVNTLSSLGLFGFVTEFRDSIDEYLKGLDSNDNMDHWSRGPVSLKRDKDKVGEDGFFEQIHGALYDEAWVKLFHIVNQESPYIKYLIYALVAADAGQWKKARGYCVKALAEPEYLRNHEALYFFAITLRHNCQELKDYQIAKERLSECKKVWGRRYPERGEDLRFVSEELALATAYFNYKKFIWPNNKYIGQEPVLSNIWERLNNLAKDIDALTHESPTIYFRVQKQVFSNLCCLFIFDRHINKKKEIEDRDGREAYLKLKEIMAKKNSRPSYFIHFLVAFLTWHFDETNDKKFWIHALKETDSAFNNHQIPYEKDKYTYFRDILVNYGKSQNWKILT